MNLSEIETFLAIVNTKSITKTADLLFLSQPTVSHRLTSLENELGFSLVIRRKGHKQVELTPKGLEFISFAERWISLWKETQALQHNQERMLLTIGSTDSPNISLLTPLYLQILKSDYLLDLNIHTHQSSELYGLLNNHDIDIGLVNHQLHYKNIISEKLFDERLYLIQSSNPVIPKPMIHTDELDSSMELFLNWDDNFQIWHERWLANSKRPHFSADTITVLSRVWTDPRSWMIAPESVIMEFARHRPVYVSELANEPPRRSYYRIKHKYPKLTTEKAVNLFDQMLGLYLESRQVHIPIGEIWGGSSSPNA